MFEVLARRHCDGVEETLFVSEEVPESALRESVGFAGRPIVASAFPGANHHSQV